MEAKVAAANAIKWIKELETTTARQGKGCLGNSITGFCCLGVANQVLELGALARDGGLGNQSSYKELGLLSGTGRASLGSRSLATLNDHHDYTFKQIAEVLRKQTDHYFIQEVAAIIKKELDNES